jgi:hypothetical protein
MEVICVGREWKYFCKGDSTGQANHLSDGSGSIIEEQYGKATGSEEIN